MNTSRIVNPLHSYALQSRIGVRGSKVFVRGKETSVEETVTQAHNEGLRVTIEYGLGATTKIENELENMLDEQKVPYSPVAIGLK